MYQNQFFVSIKKSIRLVIKRLTYIYIDILNIIYHNITLIIKYKMNKIVSLFAALKLDNNIKFSSYKQFVAQQMH